jgi:hypothetical protein
VIKNDKINPSYGMRMTGEIDIRLFESQHNDMIEDSEVRHGKGDYHFSITVLFLIESQFNTEGKMIYANGDIYEGDWTDNLKHGVGKYSSALEKWTYEGKFTLDKITGSGVLTLENGDKYSGNFHEGLMEGDGTVDYTNGDVFHGTFHRGARHGNGEYHVAKNVSTQFKGYKNFIRGLWQNDELYRGYAEELLIDNNGFWGQKLIDALKSENVVSFDILYRYGLYTGSLVDGLPQDVEAHCVYSNGAKYVGSWRSGKRNGNGTITALNRDEYVGKWVGNHMSGHGVWTSGKGKHTDESVGLNLGIGSDMDLETSESHDGIWLNNKPHGLGKRIYGDGTVWTGLWIEGRQLEEQLYDK